MPGPGKFVCLFETQDHIHFVWNPFCYWPFNRRVSPAGIIREQESGRTQSLCITKRGTSQEPGGTDGDICSSIHPHETPELRLRKRPRRSPVFAGPFVSRVLWQATWCSGAVWIRPEDRCEVQVRPENILRKGRLNSFHFVYVRVCCDASLKKEIFLRFTQLHTFLFCTQSDHVFVLYIQCFIM